MYGTFAWINWIWIINLSSSVGVEYSVIACSRTLRLKFYRARLIQKATRTCACIWSTCLTLICWCVPAVGAATTPKGDSWRKLRRKPKVSDGPEAAVEPRSPTVYDWCVRRLRSLFYHDSSSYMAGSEFWSYFWTGRTCRVVISSLDRWISTNPAWRKREISNRAGVIAEEAS